MRYSITSIAKAIQKPHLISREINRIYHQIRGNSGDDLFEKDWDNLLILDGCRYDQFLYRGRDLPGETKSIRTNSTDTQEFIRSNMADKDLSNTICVTGNAWYKKLRGELDLNFYKFYDENHKSPKPVADQALKSIDNNPNKRLFVHFLPPHTPYVGKTADTYLPDYEEQHGILPEFREWDIPDEILLKSYQENMDRVIPQIRRLLNSLNGKTVVAADHGELLGDRVSPIPMKEYGHYSGLYVDKLMEVPWHEYESGDRRKITYGEPEAGDTQIDMDSINERLKELGYK
jgi:hypothetical protein